MNIYGDDSQSQDTESKTCNAVYDKIGTTTKYGGSLNDPQVSVVYSTNAEDPRVPRVRGRSIFLTMKSWNDNISGKEQNEKKRLGALLTRSIIILNKLFTIFAILQHKKKVFVLLVVTR